MKLIRRHIDRDGSGSVTLYPEEPEDMWHAYNLIRPTDLLSAKALRRVTDKSATTGSTRSETVQLNLTIRVKSLDFDAQAGQLHVSGQIARETKHTKIGQFHTLDLELQRNFTLDKDAQDGEAWDSVAREQLAEATDQTRGTEAVAVVMQEGLANICFITQYQTVLRQRIEHSVPRKRAGAGRSADHDKGLQKFYVVTLETLMRQISTLLENKPNATFPILLGSPGFTAAGFLKHITETASSKGDKLLQDLVKRKAFLTIHTSSGHLHSLNEVLKSPEVLANMKDTKYAKETELMDKFFELLRKDDGRAWYGPKEVERAVDKGAVGRGGGTLLISHSLFRSQDIATRRRWVRLVDQVREVEGGDVRILSSDHESGRRLEGLGGIAAILTFPVDDEESASDSDGDNS
ncbi:mRNA surveillance protein pelota [Cyphellophora europaea CBS 101466]|uniref:Protein DOM34 homolog n=1 Tax=Cyphellophora europaea (strain CBS 101466) TaxID=1220924 RepID=W2S291_CYPE1|nr:mRNA surveillance protein pelota [Cyphellophora europaea CBS 101466]ETN42705.1 mRNA surveillance protein pelota [Cyphellophora europaea CBS 101466]